MRQVTKIHACRSCGASDMRQVFDIGELKINAFMPEPNTDVGSAPLTLVHCSQCDLIQLDHTVREQELYENYWYLSRLNQKIVDNLQSITSDVTEFVDFQPGDLVLDIGANDGTLLSFYDSDQVIRVGCDPAQNIHAELEQHTDVLIPDFFTLDNWQQYVGQGRQARVVTTVAMFYDLDDPNQFVSDVKGVLADDGVWLCQLMTAAPMLASNDLGNVIHEHIEYYTYLSLTNLLERHGLEIFQVRQNDINGGSYQLYIRHYTSGSVDFAENITPERIGAWADNIAQNASRTMDFITDLVSRDKKVYIMGASTKGNTIMQYYGLDSDLIAGAAEIHPDKIGKYLVGGSIPIVHEDEAKQKADYFLVFPFHFKELFVTRILSDWIADGGQLIFCTPEFEVVGAATVD